MPVIPRAAHTESEANQDYTMAPSANETKRKHEGDQDLPSSHKRKKRESDGASADKTVNQGKDSQRARATKQVDASLSTGKTVGKKGAGKARASSKTTGDPAAHSTASSASQAGGESCHTTALLTDKKVGKKGAGKTRTSSKTTGDSAVLSTASSATSRKGESKRAAECRSTTRRYAARASNGSADDGEDSQRGDTSDAADQVAQDESTVCQEMERVLSLVEQQASTIAREEPLSIQEVDQAYDALLKMHKRWRGSKRQLGRRKKDEEFKLSLSQVELIANRYRVARRLKTTVDYEGASGNVNFRLFKGNADKLKAQENHVIAMLRMALKLQQQIDDDDTEKTSEEWAQEVVKLQLAHKEDIDALQNEIRALEGANARLKADLQKTSDESVQAAPKEREDETLKLIEENASQKKDMNELRAQIEKVESEKTQLKQQLQQESGALENKLNEANADNLKLKQKVEAAEQDRVAHVTQDELDERKVKLDKQAREQALERSRIQGQKVILERKEKLHEEKVVRDMDAHNAWMKEHDAILAQIRRENAQLCEHERYVRTQDKKCRHEELERMKCRLPTTT